MEPRERSRRALQREERVVLHLHRPERGAEVAERERDVAGEEAREVDEVDALVDELSAARHLGVGAPFALVAESAAVAVAGADEHRRTVRAVLAELAGDPPTDQAAGLDERRDESDG